MVVTSVTRTEEEKALAEAQGGDPATVGDLIFDNSVLPNFPESERDGDMGPRLDTGAWPTGRQRSPKPWAKA